MITFRRLIEADLDLAHAWLNEPHVSEWWGGPQGVEKVLNEFFSPAAGDRTTYFVATLDGADIGLMQLYPWEAERADYIEAIGALHAEVGIDYLIGRSDLIGRGHGPRMIAAFLTGLVFNDPAVTAVRTAVVVANRRSWRSLESLGFQRVDEKVLPDEDHPEYVLVLPRETWAGHRRGRPAGRRQARGGTGVTDAS